MLKDIGRNLCKTESTSYISIFHATRSTDICTVGPVARILSQQRFIHRSYFRIDCKACMDTLRWPGRDLEFFFFFFHPRLFFFFFICDFIFHPRLLFLILDFFYAKTLAKIQVTAIFLTEDMRKNVFLKFIEICTETPCWCPPRWAGNQQKHLSLSLAKKRVFISQRTQKRNNNTLF